MSREGELLTLTGCVIEQWEELCGLARCQVFLSNPLRVLVREILDLNV